MRKQQALPGRLILLGSAYAPVALIVGSRLLPDKAGWIILGAGVIGLGIWIAFLAWLAHANPKEIDLKEFEPIDTEVTGYIVSLLLPVVAAGSPTGGDIVAYSICAVLILTVAFAADLGVANPIVYFAGLRVGRGWIGDTRVIVLFKEVPGEDDTIYASRRAGVIRLDTDRDQSRTEPGAPSA